MYIPWNQSRLSPEYFDTYRKDETDYVSRNWLCITKLTMYHETDYVSHSNVEISERLNNVQSNVKLTSYFLKLARCISYSSPGITSMCDTSTIYVHGLCRDSVADAVSPRQVLKKTSTITECCWWIRRHFSTTVRALIALRYIIIRLSTVDVLNIQRTCEMKLALILANYYRHHVINSLHCSADKRFV